MVRRYRVDAKGEGSVTWELTWYTDDRAKAERYAKNMATVEAIQTTRVVDQETGEEVMNVSQDS